MDLLYFARIRETIGQSGEVLTLPDNISTVDGLINLLRKKGAHYEAAFDNDALIRVAVNQSYVDFNHPVTTDDEVAFFPPMTGG